VAAGVLKAALVPGIIRCEVVGGSIMVKDKGKPKPQIIPLPRGPYYYFDEFKALPVKRLQSSHGETYTAVRAVSLCRCGGSKGKPFCDGTHSSIGFSEKKETDGKLDKRKDYVGTRVVVHDNRGLCSHVGHCVNGSPRVFNRDARPWVDANGAEIEEIIATVKQCPSGALSYSIEAVEYRDQDREPMISVAKDGPYEVTGGIELLGVTWGEGASEEHYTLCRCGGSRNKPFCDGRHHEIEFKG
jgi:CDGSH-type Zn-finger protein